MRIGNAQNARGARLLAGISAVVGSSVIASDIVAIRNGSNVTLTSSEEGVLVVGADVAATISSAVSVKIDQPTDAGSYGQVLATNGEGGTYWTNRGIESATWEGVQGKPATVAALPNAVGSAGQYLRAGAGGTVAWAGFDNAVVSSSVNAPTGRAVQSALALHADNNRRHVPVVSAGDAGKILKATANGPAWAIDSTAGGVSALSPLSFGSAVSYNGETAVGVIAGSNVTFGTVDGSTVSINAVVSSIADGTVLVSGEPVSSMVAGSNIEMAVADGVVHIAAIVESASRMEVDSALDSASVNPVENRVLWSAIGDIEMLLGGI